MENLIECTSYKESPLDKLSISIVETLTEAFQGLGKHSQIVTASAP